MPNLSSALPPDLKFKTTIDTINKKMKRFYFAAAIFATLSFAACSDDDETPGGGLTAKTYENTELAITYNGEPVIGKSVDFAPENGKATLTFSGQDFDLNAIAAGSDIGLQLPTVATCGVLPGTPNYALTVDLTGDESTCSFSGSSETTYCTFSYSGTVNAQTLSVELKDVTLKNTSLSGTSLSGTWDIPALDDNAYNVIRAVWVSSTPVNIDYGEGLGIYPMPISTILGMLFALPISNEQSIVELLTSNLKSITFGEDGNITANYLAAKGANAGTFVQSPKNIAQYVVDGDKIKVFLNPQGIAYADAANADAAKKSRAAGIDINAILGEVLGQLVPMFAEGLPLRFGAAIDAEGNSVDGLMCVYLDTDVLLPILRAVAPLFEDEGFLGIITNLIKNDPQWSSMASMISPMLQQLPGIIETTSKVEVGINLQKGANDENVQAQ